MPAMAVTVEGVVGIAGRKRGDLEPRRRLVAACDIRQVFVF